MENTPKTFKELFANTGIEPTIDENGNTHYHFNAIRKKEHKEEPSEFEITPEFTYGKEVGKTIKIKATINSIETEQETIEEVVKVKRTELFNTILSIVKQIPRKDIDYDAMDAPSCAYEIEQLFYKWQQEQDKKLYNKEEVVSIAEASFSFYRTNDFDDNELEKQWKIWLNKRLKQLKNK
jgi:hypothetical protein